MKVDELESQQQRKPTKPKFFDNTWDFPGGSDGKESTCNAGDLGLIPGSERSPGEGNGHSLQYSCLENPIDRGAWWSTVHGVTKSQTERLTIFTFFDAKHLLLIRNSSGMACPTLTFC